MAILLLCMALPVSPAQDKSSASLLEEANRLFQEARTLYESGRKAGHLQTLIDAGFKADEARVKYQAVQQIAQGENKNRAAAAVREVNQLIRLVNDARLELRPPAAAAPPVPDPVPPPSAPPPAAPPPAPPPPPEKKPPAGPAVDLLGLIHPGEDSVAGTWIVQGNKLLMTEKRGAGAPLPRLEIPYSLPEEYDFRLVFRHTGGGEIYLILSRGGAPVVFEMGGSGNRIFALRLSKDWSEDPASAIVKKARCLEGTRLYTALVEVRKEGIKAYLDDLLIVHAPVAEVREPGLDPSLELKGKGRIGIACAHQTVVAGVEVVEVRGRGRPLR